MLHSCQPEQFFMVHVGSLDWDIYDSTQKQTIFHAHKHPCLLVVIVIRLDKKILLAPKRYFRKIHFPHYGLRPAWLRWRDWAWRKSGFSWVIRKPNRYVNITQSIWRSGATSSTTETTIYPALRVPYEYQTCNSDRKTGNSNVCDGKIWISCKKVPSQWGRELYVVDSYFLDSILWARYSSPIVFYYDLHPVHGKQFRI